MDMNENTTKMSFACLIAYKLYGWSDGLFDDSLVSMERVIKAADNYEIPTDDKGYINMAMMERDANDIAYEIAKD